MSRFVRFSSLSLCLCSMVLLAFSAVAQTAQDVTTQHNDTLRTGWQQHESVLTPGTVTTGPFGLLWQYTVNGVVFAQPLAFHWNGSIGV
jgi:hypothetical protein